MTCDFHSFLGSYITSFINYRQSLGYKEITYIPTFKSIDTFLLKEYPNDTTFTEHMFNHWLLNNKDWSVNTLRTRIYQLSSLTIFILSLGYNCFFVSKEATPKRQEFIPCILTDEEMKVVFDAIDSYQSPSFAASLFEIVCPVLFRLIFTCGLRPNEPCSLKRSDVNLKTGKIKITNTKRHKSRQLYMSKDMLNLCQQYDSIISTLYPEREYFFLLKKGKKMAVYNIEYYLNTIKSKLENDAIQKMRVYDFRHNFATRSILNYMENDLSIHTYIPILSSYMGHTTFDNTYYYISLLPDCLIKTKKLDWNILNSAILEVVL